MAQLDKSGSTGWEPLSTNGWEKQKKEKAGNNPVLAKGSWRKLFALLDKPFIEIESERCQSYAKLAANRFSVLGAWGCNSSNLVKSCAFCHDCTLEKGKSCTPHGYGCSTWSVGKRWGRVLHHAVKGCWSPRNHLFLWLSIGLSWGDLRAWREPRCRAGGRSQLCHLL